MPKIKDFAPCLWFDDQAEQAARFYTALFPNSAITRISRYGKAGQKQHKRPEGSVMTVEFNLDGHPFTALNGGPIFTFNEAISMQIFCDTQHDIDYFWDKLRDGGDPKAQQCGWLKDKFGLSWQVVPTVLPNMVADPDSEKAGRAMEAIMKMKKFDIAELKRAYEGAAATAVR